MADGGSCLNSDFGIFRMGGRGKVGIGWGRGTTQLGKSADGLSGGMG